MATNQIEDGRGSGRTITVTDGGAARTEPAASSTISQNTTLTTAAGSSTLVPERIGRRNILIMNLNASGSVHVAFDNGPATSLHYRVGPGERFSFPPGVTVESEILGIAVGSDVDLSIIEFVAAEAP